MPVWSKESLLGLVQRETGEYRLVVRSNCQRYIHETVKDELSDVAPLRCHDGP